MSLKVEKTDNKNELKLEFNIEAKKFDEGIQKIFHKSAKYFNIPGFRKGKAPYHLVEKMYGKEIFYEDTFNEIVPEIYDEEIKNNNIEAVSKPEISIVQMEKGKELIFTAIVQIKPDVKLGKYKGIELKKVEYNVTDESIQDELNKMADKNSRLVTVENRTVQDGDVAVIDFEGSVDGEIFEGGTAENYELKIGSHSFIEGFEEQVIGMKTDEEKDIKVKFPLDYFSEKLKDKDAIFKVKLHEIKEKELPEINDELAKDVSEFDTLDELKASIKERLEEQNKAKEKSETEEQAISAVMETIEVDIPSGMIETEIDNTLHSFEHRLEHQGLNLDQYLQYTNQTMESMREKEKETATKSIKIRLVLNAIAKDASIEVNEKELSEKMKEEAEKYGKTEEDIKDNEDFKKYIKETLTLEKTIEYIIENAKMV